MQESFWWWQCSVRYSLPLSPPPGISVPYHCLFGDKLVLNKFHQTEIAFIVLLLLRILLFLCWTIHLIKMAKSVFFLWCFIFVISGPSGGFLQGTHFSCQSSERCLFSYVSFFVISGPSGGFLQGTHCICQSSERCSCTGMVITSSSFPWQADHSPKCLLFFVCFSWLNKHLFHEILMHASDYHMTVKYLWYTVSDWNCDLMVFMTTCPSSTLYFYWLAAWYVLTMCP